MIMPEVRVNIHLTRRWLSDFRRLGEGAWTVVQYCRYSKQTFTIRETEEDMDSKQLREAALYYHRHPKPERSR